MTGLQQKRVLLLYFSFSGQTLGLLNRLTVGLEREGVAVTREKLHPLTPMRFPVGAVGSTIWMMLATFFRARHAIRELPPRCWEEYDLIILSGPTWSYNPCGPVLALLDRDGPTLFKGKKVLPLISCRGYWRMHWYGLRAKLEKCGAILENVIVFSHPNPEPWRTIGVFLKIAGKAPERSKFLGKYYTKFGHSKSQQEEAERFGELIGAALRMRSSLAGITFRTLEAVP